MEWLQENLAVLSAVIVPILLGVIGPLISREAGSREYRRVKRHAQLRSLLADGSDAAKKMDVLLEHEVGRLADRSSTRTSRKLNGGNLAAIVVVSLIGGLVSFGLVTWAQAGTGFWAWVAWIAFALWTFSVLVFVLVGGLANLYKTEIVESDAEALVTADGS